MYEVTLYEDGPNSRNVLINDAYVSDLKIDGSGKLAINGIDTFQFTMTVENPGYGIPMPLKTLIKVYNNVNDEYEFEGRVLAPIEEMDTDGVVSKTYMCESEMGFFHDAPSRQLEFRGTPEELLITILEHFNSQVEDYKQFEPGIVEVTNSTNNMYVYLSDEKTTYEELKDKLLDRLGGEFRIRKENGVRYLDYLERIGEDVDTTIELSKNLITMSKEVDATEIVSRITPLGERIKSEDQEATDASQARLTIEEVNNGIRYIDHPELIKTFGYRGKPVVWDDITLPENLYNAGWDYLNNQKLILNKFTLEALDLSLIGIDIHSLKVGNGYPTINPLMGIDEKLRIIEKNFDINEPENSNVVIGDKFKTLSDYQKETNMQSKRIVELQNMLDRQSKTISALNDAVGNINNVVDTINVQVGEADLPGLNESINNLNEAIVALNDVVEGIPSYGLATSTYSGLMPMADKVKIDLLTITEEVNADVLNGDMETAKQNIIDLTALIEDLTVRVEALEPEEPAGPTGTTEE
ncbi:phage minor structural protein, N-terminal region [Alkalibacterium putridalgicola]|uniref:Phage minor structural protein, N-terminal region n=1 Tax=Alkalibacterium putridalgicola TaxID=426703 RepID=A0A1H7RK47_9LACT|nr:phage tail spike protein [Alkalibacterium putridalgicola]GEK88878.1 hypothetical protein APU01nite_09170 [Alkalibacterium putridalgicola]SEL60485.1 phage minor structural protein, N-terminal region [Alkalibacterium putridalgicola]